jgi:hypothetical protein
VKTPCVVATIANITLSGVQTIDGTAVVADDRVLVKDQTSAIDNGIWVVGASAWSRAHDFDGARDVVKGTAIYVFAGDTQSAGNWRLTTASPVIGTTSLAFTQDTVISVTGDVTGAASSVNSNFALFSGTTGKLLKDSSINSASFDAAGVAAAAIITHVAVSDPHTQYMERANNLSDVTVAATARTNLGLGTAAVTASSAYATAAQGTKADTALQAADIGSTLELDTTMFTANTIDTDTTLAANSDTRIATQKAIKAYADSISVGLSPRTNCRVASTAALTVTYNNGASGVGATLTNADTQAAIAIDGVTLALNDRVLIKDQVTTFQNGIYTATTLGNGASNWVLTRATDFDAASASEVAVGAYTTVTAGTVNTNRTYRESGLGAFTLGTTPIIFEIFFDSATITAGTGLQKIGNELSIDSTVATKIATTKGDLLGFSTVPARLAVGSKGKLLTADSSGTTGLSWQYGTYLNVKTVFGAAGDATGTSGVGTDDTAAIQAGLDYIAANGGVLYFPTGKYRITSALSELFTFTALSLGAPSIKGDGSRNSQIYWDGSSSPSTFMMTLRHTDSDVAGSHAHSVVEGLGFLPMSGKGGYASGLKLANLAYMSVRDIWSIGLYYGLWLDQVISSHFECLNLRFNSYGLWSVGSAVSAITGNSFANNALTFTSCIIGVNSIGGLTSLDGNITYLGGSVEANGTSGSAGSGYGVKLSSTAQDHPQSCNFFGTYLELNGTSGDLGGNAATADVWIIDGNTADNNSYGFYGCYFGRSGSNPLAYAPHGIYINKTTNNACNLTVIGCTFTDYNGYTAAPTHEYIKLVTSGSGDSSKFNLNVQGNYYNQSTEQPDFILGTTYRPGTIASYVHLKSYSALVCRNTAQSITTGTATAISFDTSDYNDTSIWSAGSPTRLTVPAGAIRIRLAGGVRYVADSTANANWQLFIRKAGSSFNGMPYNQLLHPGGTFNHTLNVSSGILSVTGGDWFELYTQQNTGSSVNTDTALSGTTWFSMEIVE